MFEYIRIKFLSFHKKIFKIVLKLKPYFINKESNEIFDIEKEAQKLGMTIEEYKKKILHEKPEIRLNEIYDEYNLQLNYIQEEKDRFNNSVKNSKQRQDDFYELEAFFNSLL